MLFIERIRTFIFVSQAIAEDAKVQRERDMAAG